MCLSRGAENERASSQVWMGWGETRRLRLCALMRKMTQRSHYATPDREVETLEEPRSLWTGEKIEKKGSKGSRAGRALDVCGSSARYRTRPGKK